MKTRAKVGFIDTNNKLVKMQDVKCESTNSQFDHIPEGNRYLDAIFSAMQEFIKEEINGNSSSEIRLIKKIEASRLLFSKDKDSLRVFRRTPF